MRILLAIALLCVTSVVFGQAKWELALAGGGWMYMGDLAPRRVPVLKETQPGAGLFLRHRLASALSLRGSFLTGRLRGADDNIQDDDIREVRLIRFQSRLMEAGLLIEWEPWANRRYPGRFQFRKIISPYVFAGGAWYANARKMDFTGMPAEGLWGQIRKDQTSEYPEQGFTIPFGAGVHFDVSKRSVFSLELAARPTLRDYLDGVSYAGNPERNDWYAFAGAHYNLRLTPKDRDNDQIPDRYDRCPTLPGVLSAMGCPDADGDGLEDLEDMCPKQPGPRAANGCPDADDDMIPDHVDDCPLQAGPSELNGCPDADKDGLADKDDRCPEQAGPPIYKGCPDTDADGIADPDDACPEEAGVPEKDGCPYRDSDGDGIYDDFDECPDQPGLPDLKGCPDTDADGIADKNDRCPNLAGTLELRGCPSIAEEDKKILLTARWGVEFETGSAVLKPKSAAVLDQIAALMEKYPVYHLHISGHTDNVGKPNKNLTLSNNRAKSCAAYLLKKHIAPERLHTQGYGHTQPIASNKTPQGRSRNRRVEFDLILPEE